MKAPPCGYTVRQAKCRSSACKGGLIKVERYASREGLVSYDGNFYAVPAVWANKMRLVKETADRPLIIVNSLGEGGAPPHKLPGRYKRAIVVAHYAGLPALASKAASAQAYQTAIPEDMGRLLRPIVQVDSRPLYRYEQLHEVAHE